MSTNYVKHFPKPLLDDLVAGRWLPIVGAGMSRNAYTRTEKKAPLWPELGAGMASEIPDYMYTSSLDAISAYCHEFGRSKMVEHLSDALLIDEAMPGTAHQAFCGVQFDIVCTTNFDFLLEHQYAAMPRRCVPILDEDQLPIVFDGSGVVLIKMHGDLHHPGRIIATEEDYDSFLSRYPLLATFVSSLLIRRTAVLVGYSLDDPDFRQIWQVIAERLGPSRRLAYAIMVDASATDVARFARRGVKVINIPGSKKRYGDILGATFNELSEYWRNNIIAASHVTEEAPLIELLLPKDAISRLCFFALPLSLHPFYKKNIFPMFQEFGFVPVTADSVISPGHSIAAKIETLIERSLMVIIDVSSDEIVMEAYLAVRKVPPDRILVIAEDPKRLPVSLLQFRKFARPNVFSSSIEEFVNSLRNYLNVFIGEHRDAIEHEFKRLFYAGEYRASIISALTIVEQFLRETLQERQLFTGSRATLLQMVDSAAEVRLISFEDCLKIKEWMKIRNEIAHGVRNVRRTQAQEIIKGIERLLNQLRE